MINLENPVLTSVKWFVDNSRHVKINYENISKVAEENAGSDFPYPSWDFDCLPKERNDAALEFFFLMNCLNFKFWHTDTKERFSAIVNGDKYIGAFAMFGLFNKWQKKNPNLLTGQYLKNMTIEIARKNLSGIRGPIPMLRRRVEIMKEAGNILTSKYSDFNDLVERSEYLCFNNGRGIVERLIEDFPSFRDEYQFHGRRIILNKRAQLAPAMVYAKFRGTGNFDLKDIDKLTAFADYQLPKGLLGYGILEYSSEMEKIIKKREFIPKGSRLELEIRANTVLAVHILLGALNERRNGLGLVNAVQMDYHLWKRGREENTPYHLTETSAY